MAGQLNNNTNNGGEGNESDEKQEQDAVMKKPPLINIQTGDGAATSSLKDARTSITSKHDTESANNNKMQRPTTSNVPDCQR